VLALGAACPAKSLKEYKEGSRKEGPRTTITLPQSADSIRIKRYQLFKLDILDTKLFNERCKDTLRSKLVSTRSYMQDTWHDVACLESARMGAYLVRLDRAPTPSRCVLGHVLSFHVGNGLLRVVRKGGRDDVVTIGVAYTGNPSKDTATDPRQWNAWFARGCTVPGRLASQDCNNLQLNQILGKRHATGNSHSYSYMYITPFRVRYGARGTVP